MNCTVCNEKGRRCRMLPLHGWDVRILKCEGCRREILRQPPRWPKIMGRTFGAALVPVWTPPREAPGANV